MKKNKIIIIISGVFCIVFYYLLLSSIKILYYPESQVAITIPDIYTNLNLVDGELTLEVEGQNYSLQKIKKTFSLEKIRGGISGSEQGIDFDFRDITFSGNIYYGFINIQHDKVALPPFFRESALIKKGKASIDITVLSKRFDTVSWQKKGFALLGYRIANDEGVIIYDGKVFVSGTGPFKVGPGIIEGPFVNKITHQSVVISFDTDVVSEANLEIDGRIVVSNPGILRHEIAVDQLDSNKLYDYQVVVGKHRQSHHFTTAPKPGSRQSFGFAFASDSRAGMGSGERNIWGVNAYIMKRIMALALSQKVAFLQFTGDMINGYSQSRDDMRLQYSNWLRSIEPYAHYLPVYTAMGNHEALLYIFAHRKFIRWGLSLDRFPFGNQCSQGLFAEVFVNPENSILKSEDGSRYDPNTRKQDFPSYQENVYHYQYGNMAMVVLNSNYWYSPSLTKYNQHGGNLHGYIMDNQLQYLRQILTLLDADENVDYVFVTIHTPLFPNGGHVKDAMWYNGANDPRPSIAGKKVDIGIIQRRDELLLAIMRSSKTIAILTGDEHNYQRMLISKDMPMYPDDWNHARINENESFRQIYQIVNGAAGAPYYAQEPAPWSSYVQMFSAQNALVFFDINKPIASKREKIEENNGNINEVIRKEEKNNTITFDKRQKAVYMRVINPDTLVVIDESTIELYEK